MNLFELIQLIPKFIEDMVSKKTQLKAQSEQEMVGKFYLGLLYDYQQICMQNQSQGAAGILSASKTDSRAREGVAIYPCHLVKQYDSKNDSG